MIIEQDKTNPNLFVATGKIFGHPIIAEGTSQSDALTQWVACATARVQQDLATEKHKVEQRYGH